MTLPGWADGQTVHDTDLLLRDAAINNLALITTGANSGIKTAAPSAKALINASQSIANNTDTLVTMNTVAWDTDGMFNATNPFEFTVNTPGKYLVSIQTSWPPNATGMRAGKVYLNVNSNAALISSSGVNATVGGFDTIQTSTAVWNAVAGDTVRFGVFQTSGGALNIQTAFGGTWMMVHRLTI